MKSVENKVQIVLRKIKQVFTEKEYKHLYPIGSKPSAFYCTAKIHKLKKEKDLRNCH